MGSSVGNVIKLLIPFFVFLLIIFIVIFLKADKKKENPEEDEKKKKKRCCCGGGKKKQKEKKKVPKKSLEEQIEDKKGQNAAARLLGDQALLGRMQGSKSETTITASSEDINRGDGQVIADRVKVVYGWLQCFTAITFTFDVAWPANLKGFSLSLNLINLDLGNMMAGSKCSFAISSLEKFYVHMALPAVLLVVILLARIPAMFLRKSKTQRAKQKAMMMKLITALALIMYPGICVRLFSTLKCIKVPGLSSDVHSGRVMASDYAVQCYVGEHATAVVVALICGITWVLGIPAAVLVALRCNRKYLYMVGKEGDEEHLAKHEDVVGEFGTLFLQYEPKYYWWEVTVIFKKMMLTGAMTIIQPGSSAQLVIALLIVLLNMLFVLKLAPFADDADDYLSFLTSFQMLLTLLGGLLIKTDNPSDPTYDSSKVGLVLVVVNSFGFVALAFSLIALHPKVRACLNRSPKSKSGGIATRTQVMPISNTKSKSDEDDVERIKNWSH